MNSDFLKGINYLLGKEKAEAYKAGFTHGVQFAENSSTSTIALIDKVFRKALDGVAYELGQGREYKTLVECLNAIRHDLLSGEDALPLEYYWEDEDDL